MLDNTPVTGCLGCGTTAGRLACATHAPVSVSAAEGRIYWPPVSPFFVVASDPTLLLILEELRAIRHEMERHA